MLLKVKKRTPDIPKAESKRKDKKAVLKGFHSTQNWKPTCHPPSRDPSQYSSEGSPNILGSAPQGETVLSITPARSSPDR